MIKRRLIMCAVLQLNCLPITRDIPTDESSDLLFDVLNEYRTENGLKPLVYSSILEAAAKQHLEDMANRGYFAHESPEGLHASDRAMDLGWPNNLVGENLAMGYTIEEDVMEAWINSESHNDNMLHSRYVYVGMGHFVADNGVAYWAQVFAFEY